MKACTAVSRGLLRGWRLRGLGAFVLSGGVFLASWAPSSAAPAASKMLEYRPRNEAPVTTPTQAEVANCKVELDKDKTGTGSAWVLKDASGRLLRRFYSRDGRNIDTYSYYRDGVEIYRETVSAGSRVPDQFRWLNSGGSKWGVDEDKNGTIDTWRAISAEEVSQEVLRALATRDLYRLQVLLLTDDDIRALGLPTDLADSIRARRKEIKAKFEATITKLPKLTEKANWQHLETGAPECVPAEQIGGSKDLIRYSRATVLFESGGTNEWFQVGPMIKVGNAWKVIDAPAPGAATMVDADMGTGTAKSGAGEIPLNSNPKLKALVEKLTDLDKAQVASSGPEAATHHLNRADILEQIVALVDAKERDPWIRQVADSLSAAVQAAPTNATAATRLGSLEKQLSQHIPGSNLTGYVAYRRLQAEYSVSLGSGKPDFEKVQKEWLEKLTAFVKAYPKAEDTPDAMLQLGMVCEFLGKEVEAKNWYSQLAKTYPDKIQGQKAGGAYRRLSMDGQTVTVSGPTLAEASTSFEIEKMAGKVVIVYYWASWNGQAVSDFGKLKNILRDNKEVDLLGVNLDAKIEDAKEFLAKNSVPGTHLYQPGGLESKLGIQYGINVLPSIILVGKDGKCINKAGQISTLEDDIKKHLKK